MLFWKWPENWVENEGYSTGHWKHAQLLLNIFLTLPPGLCGELLKNRGAPAEKLVVGFGACAHTCTLTNCANMAWMLPPLALGLLGHVLRKLGLLPTLR